jgi:hypothetical protein
MPPGAAGTIQAYGVCGLGSTSAGATSAILGWQVAESGATPIAAASAGTASASCPSGTVALGGGYLVSSPEVVVTASAPVAGGWEVQAFNPGAEGSIAAYVVCAS